MRKVRAQAAQGQKQDAPFWAWVTEGAQMPTLALTGTIYDVDDGDWYEDAVTPARFSAELAAHEGEEIMVSINSPWGDVFAGYEIYNMLSHRQGITNVRVTGLAASAASYIAMAASPGRLTMCQASLMMIHKPMTAQWGNADEMRKAAQVLDDIEDVMAAIYARRWRGTDAALREALRAETWMSPTQAMEAGLCDAIVTPFEAEEGERGAAARQMARIAAIDRGHIARMREAMGLPRERAAAKPEQPAPQRTDVREELARVDALLAGLNLM